MTHPETQSIRTQADRSHHREHAVPLYLTSSFAFDSAEQARALFADEIQGPLYSRYSNPNTDEFVQKLVQLERAESGIATASGMSAVFLSIAALVSSGDHIVASRALFGSTHQLLTRVFPKWGVSHTYVDGATAQEFEPAITPKTKLIFIETPSNPGLDLIDLASLGALAKARGIPLVVDNTFATPVLSRPIEHGASLIAHSATKYIDGQGRTLGGALVGDKALIAEARFLARHTGPALSPFNAWVLSKSIETLALRMEKHSFNAYQVAKALEQHPGVLRVRYPGLPSHPQYALARKQMDGPGGILTIELGNYGTAVKFLDSVRLVSHTLNLGDTRSIVTHPASTTHSKLTEEERQRVGITPGLVRVSVGLEKAEDIIADLEQAVSAAKGAVTVAR